MAKNIHIFTCFYESLIFFADFSLFCPDRDQEFVANLKEQSQFAPKGVEASPEAEDGLAINCHGPLGLDSRKAGVPRNDISVWLTLCLSRYQPIRKNKANF